MANQPSVNSAAVVPGGAKSFAYDENYPDPQVAVFVLGALGSATGNSGSPNAAILGGLAGKQVRCITVIPLVAPTAADFIGLTLQSYSAQVFGTATATAVTVGNGTNLGTGINKVQFCIYTALVGTTTGSYVGPTGTQFVGLGTQAAYNPTTIQLVGGTCTVIVTAPAGTNTQGNYVFPAGPNGGLTVAPNDVLVISRGTDTLAQYAVEVEYTFTPGGNFSR
jgi:hypothetical protein